jgi:menaquinone-dependent protoporphyrinogen oxidase
MKALIAYSSNTGVTEEIARRIGAVMESNGFKVELVNLKKGRPKPDSYNLVLVGSGIKMGSWIKDSLQFLDSNTSTLRMKPTALFVSCGDAAVEEKRSEAQTKYLDEVAAKRGINPISSGLFAGCYRWDKYNFFVKQVVKGVLREGGLVSVDTGKTLDYRDWDAIETWAKDLIVLTGGLNNG